VGEVLNQQYCFHAFLSQDGTSRDLGTLRTGRNSTAYGINRRGQIVGTGDVISSIDRIVDPFTGRVTYRTNYEDHAFLYDGRTMLDLNSLIQTNSGWTLSYAFDINEAGVVVGWGQLDGEWHGYLLVPVKNEGRRWGASNRPPTPHRRQSQRLPLPHERWWMDWEASHLTPHAVKARAGVSR
jgi:uncharacterized membrane protein